MSPVRYQPSRNAAAVSDSGRYPAIATGSSTSISPVSPAASTSTALGVDDAHRTPGVPGSRGPTVSRRHRSGSCTGLHAMTGTSLVPYAGSQRTPDRRVTVSATSGATGVAPHIT